MPQNIEDMLQLIDQDDDYLEGLDLIAPGAPLDDIEEGTLLDDQDLVDLDEF